MVARWQATRYGERTSDDNFSVEESAALLHAIFPNYPELKGEEPAPETGAFLRSLRVRESRKDGEQ